MAVRNKTVTGMIGRVASELARLPEEDLPLVIEFVDYLKQQRQVAPRQRLSVAEMRAEARRRASLLCDVPRSEIVNRFRELAEEIRQEAIAKGTAIEGDWCED
jgi:hypothetical protein